MKCRICGADLSEQGPHEFADSVGYESARRKLWQRYVDVGYLGSYADFCAYELELEGADTVIMSGGVDGEEAAP